MYQGRPRKQFSPLWTYCEARASLCVGGKELITPFYPPRRCREACASQFKFQGRSRKQFSPLWRPYEVCASLFMCGKDLIKHF